MLRTFIQNAPSFLLDIFRYKRSAPAPEAAHAERGGSEHEIRLSGRLFELYAGRVVRELNWKTPRSLKYLKETCPKCMEFPEDCKYVDYSIFNVKKAAKKLSVHPPYIQERVIEEMERVNPELAYHLKERLS